MIKTRLLFVLLIILLLFVGLIIKLVDIQIVRSDELQYFAQRQHLKEEAILPDRGLIYDRNNILLAYSRNTYSLYVDKNQTDRKSRERLATYFSKIFGRSKSHYQKLINSTGYVVCIEKKVDDEKILYLREQNVSGFYTIPNPSRIYQYNNLASHLLGYVDTDFEGRNGIEQFKNNSLKGIEGKRIIEVNAKGEITGIAENETRTAIAGSNIVLTIDKTIQNILEEELRESLKTYSAASASGIIVDPNSGEILALANIEDFDPNNYNKFSDDIRRNKIVTDTYEPGSTFKSVTFASLIDQNLIGLNEKIYVENGRYRFSSVFINDSHKFEWLTARGVFEQSSNIGTVKLVQRIDGDTYYRYLRNFGFGSSTSIELPSESKGKLKIPSQWNKLTKAFVSHGYEISVTPVQMAMAYCALVNGGILYEPQLIKSEISPSGVVLFESSPKEVRRVITGKTSSIMRNLMKGVVTNGTGKNAESNILQVAGKTGTSQKLINGSYSKTEYNSSFIGFFPTDSPRAVCLILVNSPSVGKYGGLVAAPVFKKIAERTALAYPLEYQPPKNVDEVKDEIKVIYAKETDNAKNKKDSYITNELKDNNLMPDLTNLSIRDAVQILSNLGIRYKIKGSGKIVQQSILPGETVKKKVICELICSELNSSKVVVY